MPRIGIDARLTYYRQGGIATYTTNLIRQFAALDETGAYFILHSRKDRQNLATGANQRKVSCWTPAHHPLERLALAAEIAPLRLDLLHSPDYIPPLGGRYKSIITIHDLAFLRYPEILTADSRRYYNGQIEAAARRADHIIAVSESTRADVIDRLSVPPEKVTVIHEAPGEACQPAPPEVIARLRDAYRLPEAFILFVGTYEPRKNIDGLLRAYALLCADLPSAPSLVLAGRRGWLYEPLFTLAADLKLNERIVWLEDLRDDDLPALYSAAQALCLPSHYEGFGLPALEAMACGAPVVVSDRSSLPEVVGEAGLLCDPDDPASIAASLRRLLTDSALSVDLRKRGIARAGQFSWRRAAEETLSLYRRVLTGS